MKQVAKKSTTKLPQKLIAESHQPNGLVPLRDSSAENVSATASSSTLSLSSKNASSETGRCKILTAYSSNQPEKVHLTNGICDSREQSLGNRETCSDVRPNAGSISADTVQKQFVNRSECSIFGSSNLPHSLANVQPPATLKSTLDSAISVLAKRDTKESAKLCATVSSDTTDDVIIVKTDDNCKPDTKRTISATNERDCEAKRPRLDAAICRSVQVEGKDKVSRKV